jgi:glycerophosphoryl diester phosphodiesterase
MQRLALTAALLSTLGLAAASPAQAANPWLKLRVMNMAHQGGEDEAPSSTLYAFKRARGLGVDMLELDVHATADSKLVVIHDAKVDRTTNGSGFVGDMTLAQVQALDGAHNFVPGRNAVSGLPASSYPFRGVRTGAKPPPPGYAANDFRIPTLQEVFQTFPDIPINIEIKGRADSDIQSFLRHAELLAAFMKASGRRDVIVVSFNDLAVDRFHQLAPRVPVAPGPAGVARFRAGLSPGDGVVALQVPPQLGGVPVATPEFVRDAHARGYAVHVWPSDGEDNAFYNSYLDMCADGLMPSSPLALETVMRRRGIVRPRRGGVDPCGRDSTARVAPACAARASGLSRMSRRGAVRVRIVRTGVGLSRCDGVVSLRTKRRYRIRGRGRRTLGLARRSFVLPAGRRATTVRLRVPRRRRGLVPGRRGRRVSARVRMRGGSAAANLVLRRAKVTRHPPVASF